MAHLGIHCRILAEAWKESATVITRVAITSLRESSDSPACFAIRCCVGRPLIIPMIIQTILLDPSGAVWNDEAANVSRLDPSGAVQIDAEHASRNRKVVGSNPTSGSVSAGQSICMVILSLALLASLIILRA
jgi:hypothetical protein